jgi:2-iminobutanoate/2-iminopropanoate deaminase
MSKQIISTPKAPAAVGPYSQAVKTGPLVFASGQLPLDPETGLKVTGGVAKETERALENLKAVLEAAGCGLEQVVRVTVFLNNLDDSKFVNEVYQRHFPKDPPARTMVQASIPRGCALEIDAIAVQG